MIGSRVAIKDTYRDEALRERLVGTVEDVYYRPDYHQLVYVVMFEDDKPGPPGGEFSFDMLEVLERA